MYWCATTAFLPPNAYRFIATTTAGILATLAATYPVIERLGGASWFAQTVAQYRTRFPSRSGDLQFAGDRYAEYLATDLAGTNYEYFADVARLEWAYQDVLTAADCAPLDPAALGTVAAQDHPRLVFVPRPALRLVESRYPILKIWRANQPGADPALPVIGLDAGTRRVLVIRRADHVELRELAQPSHTLLSQFMRGIALEVAADAIADTELGPALQQLIALETVGGFYFKAAAQ
jgi:hypothetical protein